MTELIPNNIFKNIKLVLETARNNSYKAVNFQMVQVIGILFKLSLRRRMEMRRLNMGKLY